MPDGRATDSLRVQAKPNNRNWRRWLRSRSHPPVRLLDLNVQLDTQLTRHSTFLKTDGSPNIPIQAIGLSLYEELGTSSKTSISDKPHSSMPERDVETIGKQVTRTQWLDLSSLEMSNLIGKNVLIVDEVDDTRTTLEYAVRELSKDVESARKASGRMESQDETRFSVFVLHNKDKIKKGHLPAEMLKGRYLAAETIGDEWICYPWEARDIDEHDRLAALQHEK